MNNVVDFFSRGQKWKVSYEGPGVTASVSTRGQVHLMVGDGEKSVGVTLPFVEFVSMLSQLSESLDEHVDGVLVDKIG